MSSASETAGDPWARLRTLPAGTEVEIRRADGRVFRGSIVPLPHGSDDRIVQVKLPSGYNAGIHVGTEDRIEILSGPAEGWAPRPSVPATAPVNEGEWVAILTTGGTIASRVDYRTGGVKPVRDEAEILTFYPHLGEKGPVRIVPVFDRLSEEIVPSDWLELARRVEATFRDGARGIVIAHGTDTLAYSAAALSFALRNLPGPVVLVGAQRSPDRPSSDGSSNLGAATDLARTSDLGEVVVVMHAGLSDTEFAIHRGTRVRKMHSTRRDAFETRNGAPLGKIDAAGVHLRAGYLPRAASGLSLDLRIDERAVLLWFHPGLTPERAERFVEGARGVILAGTGLGHVGSGHFPWIRRAIERGTVVGMTTQCLAGLADPFVYSTGRELGRIGVTYLGDLLPETAYVKLLFALGRSDTPSGARRTLMADLAGEFESRRSVTEAP
jgi:glutamyl-tRNA(Gln) amidotransferase subunit D